MFTIFCSLIAAAFIAALLLSCRYPRIKCEIGGHEPKCSIVGYAMRWHCERCDKEVGPL